MKASLSLLHPGLHDALPSVAPIIASLHLPPEQTVETDQVRDGKVCLLTYPLSSP